MASEEFEREIERRRHDPAYRYRTGCLHGLGTIIAALYRGKPHGLTCQCASCLPDGPELPLAPVKRPVPAPSVPKTGHKAQKGYGKPRRKWDQRCSTCGGAGEIRDLSGAFIPCARCSESTE